MLSRSRKSINVGTADYRTVGPSLMRMRRKWGVWRLRWWHACPSQRSPRVVGCTATSSQPATGADTDACNRHTTVTHTPFESTPTRLHPPPPRNAPIQRINVAMFFSVELRTIALSQKVIQESQILWENKLGCHTKNTPFCNFKDLLVFAEVYGMEKKTLRPIRTRLIHNPWQHPQGIVQHVSPPSGSTDMNSRSALNRMENTRNISLSTLNYTVRKNWACPERIPRNFSVVIRNSWLPRDTLFYRQIDRLSLSRPMEILVRHFFIRTRVSRLISVGWRFFLPRRNRNNRTLSNVLCKYLIVKDITNVHWQRII